MPLSGIEISIRHRNAGCIYAMPINRCPFCDEEFASDNSGGLLILPIEPFSTSTSSPGEGEDDRAAREAEQQSRYASVHPSVSVVVDVVVVAVLLPLLSLLGSCVLL